MLRSAILQPNAFPARIAIDTALSFSAGNAPGSPRHTGHTSVLGGAPKAVEQPQKIFVLVRSWACTSSPITGSQSARGIGALPDLDHDRAGLRPIEGKPADLGGAVGSERQLQHHPVGRLRPLRIAQIGDTLGGADHVFASQARFLPEPGQSRFDQLAEAVEVPALVPGGVAETVPALFHRSPRKR